MICIEKDYGLYTTRDCIWWGNMFYLAKIVFFKFNFFNLIVSKIKEKKLPPLHSVFTSCPFPIQFPACPQKEFELRPQVEPMSLCPVTSGLVAWDACFESTPPSVPPETLWGHLTCTENLDQVLSKTNTLSRLPYSTNLASPVCPAKDSTVPGQKACVPKATRPE